MSRKGEKALLLKLCNNCIHRDNCDRRDKRSRDKCDCATIAPVRIIVIDELITPVTIIVIDDNCDC